MTEQDADATADDAASPAEAIEPTRHRKRTAADELQHKLAGTDGVPLLGSDAAAAAFTDALAAPDSTSDAAKRPTTRAGRREASDATAQRKRGRPRVAGYRTRSEVLSENERLKALVTPPVPVTITTAEELELSRDTVAGIIEILNFVATAKKAPELVYDADETSLLSRKFAKPAAPMLAKLGDKQPWVMAILAVVTVTVPKVAAYQARLENEARQTKSGKIAEGEAARANDPARVAVAQEQPPLPPGATA